MSSWGHQCHSVIVPCSVTPRHLSWGHFPWPHLYKHPAQGHIPPDCAAERSHQENASPSSCCKTGPPTGRRISPTSRFPSRAYTSLTGAFLKINKPQQSTSMNKGCTAPVGKTHMGRHRPRRRPPAQGPEEPQGLKPQQRNGRRGRCVATGRRGTER